MFYLDDLMIRVVNNDPHYMLNFGSETTPPCKEQVIHLTVDTPLELPFCQFKLLRESSLVKSRAKEIHSRLEKPLNDRDIYKFDSAKLKLMGSLPWGSVPNCFKKYIAKSKKVKFNKKLPKSNLKKPIRKILKKPEPACSVNID